MAEHNVDILVIGGGPAGMSAARVSALRGHDVTLYEADPEMEQAEHSQLRERVGRFWEKAGDLS